MWKKVLLMIFLFCLFALLQGSFFVHFNFFGAVPNLVFILFLLLVFFDKEKGSYKFVFWAIVAGFLLDVFSYTYIGPSIFILLVIGILVNKIRSMLKNAQDKHPIGYFLPIFFVSLLIYDLLSGLYLYFFDPIKMITIFDSGIIFSLIYNLFFATIIFYIYKAFLIRIKR